MNLRRRNLLTMPLLGLGAYGLGMLPTRHASAATDPRMAERALGNPSAKVKVEEWFSLTCTHCARFAQEVFPEVKTKLIDTGKIYYTFKDFPLDQVALLAAMVARSLPVERYEPFVIALLSSQDRWAFAQDVNPQEQIQKMAALAGMSADQFAAVAADDGLKQAIMNEQNRAEAQYQINATPTFRFNSTQVSREMTFDEFSKSVAAASS